MGWFGKALGDATKFGLKASKSIGRFGTKYGKMVSRWGDDAAGIPVVGSALKTAGGVLKTVGALSTSAHRVGKALKAGHQQVADHSQRVLRKVTSSGDGKLLTKTARKVGKHFA